MSVSVRRRFAFTVGANLARSAISFATGMLLARWLAPDVFGKMAFLLGTFLALRQLLDMGSSTAFFTFMSQRVRSRRFVNAFLAWLGVQFVIPLVAIALLFPASWIDLIWHGEHRALVLCAFAAAFMQNSLWPAIQQAGESQRQTIRVQTVIMSVVAVHLLAVVTLWFTGTLGLYAVFAAVALEYLVAVIIVRSSLAYSNADDPAEAEPVLRRYVSYCLPLIPYTWAGFAYEFADRWLLQQYGGSVQQAYYAVSAQFAAVALIATTSVLNIFWKEVAEAHHRKDHERTGALYRKVSRLLFFVGATIAGFLVWWAEDLLRLVLGAAYASGATTLAIMFFYPVHQSMGQIGSTMLYATERVGIQVGVGIAFMLLSVVVSYFVLAPQDAALPGLGLASTGVALKMVTLQFVQVNVLAFIISRIWKWRFDWWYQPVGLAGCLALGWLAHELAVGLGAQTLPLLVTLALAAALYGVLLIGFIYAMPWLAGFRRDELMADVDALVRKTRLVLKAK
jgi:O-antigen/teichoic acid export membrane protein